jgi:hypothetical protein
LSATIRWRAPRLGLYVRAHVAQGETAVGDPLSFSDSELAVLEALAKPIDHGRRDAFLQAVVAGLAGERGEGRVHQVARQVQREFFSPPQFNSPPAPRR